MPPHVRTPAPVTLRVVIGVFAAAALVTALTALGSGVLGVGPLLVAVALAVLAVRLHHGGRVARALAAVTATALLLLALGTASSAWWIVVGLATTAASVVLLLAPSTRAYFAGPAGRAPATAVSIVLVQIVACVAGVALAIGALVLFGVGLVAVGSGSAASSGAGGALAGAVGGLFGMLGGFAIALALFYGALAAFWLWSARALPRGSRGARVAVTIVCGLNALPTLASLGFSPGLGLAGFALLAAVAGALWLPDDARGHFGDAPLPAVGRWHRAAIDLGTSTASAVSSTTVPGAATPGAATPGAPTPGGHGPHVPATAAHSPRPAPAVIRLGHRVPTPTAAGPRTPSPGIPVPRSADDDAPTGRTRVHAASLVPVVAITPSPASAETVPVADLDADPLTEPVRLGRHARREPGPAEQPA